MKNTTKLRCTCATHEHCEPCDRKRWNTQLQDQARRESRIEAEFTYNEGFNFTTAHRI